MGEEQGLSAERSPFIFAALIKNHEGPGMQTLGARGGVLFGASADEVRGAKVAEFLDGGWSIEILEVEPMSPDCIASIKSYAARSEGLHPPVGVEGEVFSSLGASKAPSCGSPTDRQTSAVLVPREPTEAMLRAYKGALKALIESEPSPSARWGKGTVRGYAISEAEKCRARWAAMIDAAPPTDRQTSGGEA